MELGGRGGRGAWAARRQETTRATFTKQLLPPANHGAPGKRASPGTALDCTDPRTECAPSRTS